MTAPSPCPLCPDGHPDPGSVNWGVSAAGQRDDDFVAEYLTVHPTGVGHVVASDLKWLSDLIGEHGRPAPPPADPDRPCYHPDAHVTAAFGRIGENDPGNPTPGMPSHFMLELRVACVACGEPFKFDGVPAGLSFTAPAVSVDGHELRTPIRPVSMPPLHRRAGRAAGFHITAPTEGEP